MPTLPRDHLERFLAPGFVTSPNYPNIYPNNLQKTQTIQVEQGLVLSMQFTAFAIQGYKSPCISDYLTITDGDGTTLMEKICGPFVPTNMTSKTNIVNLIFITDNSWNDSGWNLSWSGVTQGA